MMHHFKRAACLFLVTISLLLSLACTPEHVVEVGRQAGVEIPLETAKVIALQHDQSVEGMIRDQWPGTTHDDTAVAVARCESGLRADAKNGRSSATGVFQLLSMHWRGLFDPRNARANIAKAYAMWRESGWTPWNESRPCWG